MGSNLCRFKKRRVFLIIIGSPMKIIVLCEVHNPGVTWVIFGGTCWVVLSTKRWKNWGFHYRKQRHELQRLNWYPSVMFLTKKNMSLWWFFFPALKKKHIPQKNIWRRIAQAAWRLGSEVFSIKKKSSEGWARSLSGYPGSRSKECPGTSSKFGSEKITKKKTNKTWYKVGL